MMITRHDNYVNMNIYFSMRHDIRLLHFLCLASRVSIMPIKRRVGVHARLNMDTDKFYTSWKQNADIR